MQTIPWLIIWRPLSDDGILPGECQANCPKNGIQLEYYAWERYLTEMSLAADPVCCRQKFKLAVVESVSKTRNWREDHDFTRF